MKDILIALGVTLSLTLLFLYGFYATFYPKKVVAFYLKHTFLFDFQKRMIEKRWFYVNMRIVGVVAMFMSLLVLFAEVSNIIKNGF